MTLKEGQLRLKNNCSICFVRHGTVKKNKYRYKGHLLSVHQYYLIFTYVNIYCSILATLGYHLSF